MPAGGFEADVLPILTRRCTAPDCHGDVRPQQQLVLTAATAYRSLVGTRSVACPALALPPAERETIARRITQGAADDRANPASR